MACKGRKEKEIIKPDETNSTPKKMKKERGRCPGEEKKKGKDSSDLGSCKFPERKPIPEKKDEAVGKGKGDKPGLPGKTTRCSKQNKKKAGEQSQENSAKDATTKATADGGNKTEKDATKKPTADGGIKPEKYATKNPTADDSKTKGSETNVDPNLNKTDPDPTAGDQKPKDGEEEQENEVMDEGDGSKIKELTEKDFDLLRDQIRIIKGMNVGEKPRATVQWNKAPGIQIKNTKTSTNRIKLTQEFVKNRIKRKTGKLADEEMAAMKKISSHALETKDEEVVMKSNFASSLRMKVARNEIYVTDEMKDCFKQHGKPPFKPFGFNWKLKQ